MTKTILFLGDIHVGSKVAVSLPEVYTHDGMRICYNPLQEKLYNLWCDMVDNVGRVDAVVVNGDSVDGTDSKAKGIGDWTTNLYEQVDVATDLLKMIHCNTYFGTQGSNYHVETNVSCDKLLMDKLGGKWNINIDLDCDNVRMHFRHKVGYSKNPQSRPGQLKSERVAANRHEARKGHYNVLCRSHVHRYVVSGGSSLNDGSDEWEISGPGWKWMDDFISTGSMDIPDVGYILFYVDGDEYTWEQHVCQIDEDITTTKVRV